MARQRAFEYDVTYEYWDPIEQEMRELFYHITSPTRLTNAEIGVMTASWALEAIEDYRLASVGVFDASNLLRGSTIRRHRR